MTTTMKHFDAIIIGTGQAGPFLAARFAGAGKSIAIIERHKFGGTCVNTGWTSRQRRSWRVPTLDPCVARREEQNMVSSLMMCTSILSR